MALLNPSIKNSTWAFYRGVHVIILYYIIFPITLDATPYSVKGDTTTRRQTHATAPPTITPLATPVVLKLHPDGTLPLAFEDIATVTPKENVVTTISRSSLSCADLGEQNITVTAQLIGAQPDAVSFNTPTYLLADAAGNLVIADNNSNVVRYITNKGKVTTIMKGDNSPYSNGSGINRSPFAGPNGLAMDAAGNLYVVESDFNRIVMITPGGVKSIFTGSKIATNNESEDGNRLGATFIDIHAMIAAPDGNLYVTGGDNKIRRISPDGTVFTIAGPNEFQGPEGITIGKDGNLYIADTGHNSIKKVTPGGVVSTYTGNLTPGAANGPLATASFNGPTGITIDTDGNFYVADEGNGRIRKISAAGQVSNLTTGFGSPTSIGVDAAGELFVIDGDYIKKISPDGKVSIYAGGAAITSKDGDVSPAAGPPVSLDIRVKVINSTPEAVVEITSSPAQPCEGALVTLTAATTNIGTNAAYQWQVNDLKQPLQPENTFSSTELKNGDKVICTVFFNDSDCATPRKTESMPVTLVLSPLITPIITVTPSTNAICEGTTVAFLASSSSALNNPSYHWEVNGVAKGSNSPDFTTTDLKENDVVICHVETGLPCTAQPEVASSPIAITVTPAPLPMVTITPATISDCEGTELKFSAKMQNNIDAPVYQWQVNGVNTGITGPAFTSTALHNGDRITCIVTGGGACSRTGVSNEVTVSLQLQPVIQFNDVAVRPGESIQLTPLNYSHDAGYRWIDMTAGLNNTSVVNPRASPLVTTTYTLQATSPYGCETVVRVTVVVVSVIAPANTFTPNDDGINDFWVIKDLDKFATSRVNIFNRFGQAIFSSTGYSKPWDGTYRGKELPAGTYYYTIQIKPGELPVSGYVVIIR